MRIWLKDAREKRGLTQKQIISKMNISKATYCNIENGIGKLNLSLPYMKQLAEALEIPLERVTESEAEYRALKFRQHEEFRREYERARL